MLVRKVIGPTTVEPGKTAEYKVTKWKDHDPSRDHEVKWVILKGDRLPLPEITTRGPVFPWRVPEELDGQTVQVFPYMRSPARHVSVRTRIGAMPNFDGMPWFAVARQELERGVDEIAGHRHNPRILEYHATTTYAATNDETPWCSSFVNYCIEQAGLPGTDSAAARSWLQWGRPLDHPQPGCIVVFSRGSNPAHGHVTFYYGPDPNNSERILVLGGNQSDSVSISSYPKSRILGYRLP